MFTRNKLKTNLLKLCFAIVMSHFSEIVTYSKYQPHLPRLMSFVLKNSVIISWQTWGEKVQCCWDRKSIDVASSSALCEKVYLVSWLSVTAWILWGLSNGALNNFCNWYNYIILYGSNWLFVQATESVHGSFSLC